MSEPARRPLLVPGGSRSIGAAVACQAAQAGWDVAANGRVDAAAATEVKQAAQAGGRRACVMPADEARVGAMFRAVDGERDSTTSRECEYPADVFAARDELSFTAAP